MAMKCADLGHLASAESVHLKWVHALEEEMFRQGDLEKTKGYPVSPLMDRTKTGITKSQPGVSVLHAFGGMVKSCHSGMLIKPCSAHCMPDRHDSTIAEMCGKDGRAGNCAGTQVHEQLFYPMSACTLLQFFNLFVLPLYEGLAAVLPDMAPLYQQVQNNHQMWVDLAEAAQAGTA